MFSTGARGVLQFARGLEAHDAFNAAASIAFRLFLSLVPLLVMVGYFIGQFARARGVDQVLGPLLDVIPAGAEELVRKELDRLAGGGPASMAPLGIIGFLWTASSGLHNLMGVLEVAVHGNPRPWWKKRAIAILWVLAGLAVACSFVWLVIHLDATRSLPSGARPAVHIHGPPPAPVHHGRRLRLNADEQLVDALLALILGTMLLAAFYRFAVEHSARIRRRVWPGAFAAVLFWLFVSWVFGAYAVSIANYTIYYGGLAAVAVLLLWLYLTSFALVFGAEVNAQLEGIRDRAASGRR